MYSTFSSLRHKVERIFSLPVMLQFVSSVVIVAMTAFQVIVVGDGSKSSIIMDLLLCCVLCQLFVYCWFGNEVYEQVMKVQVLRKSCYRKSIFLHRAKLSQPPASVAVGTLLMGNAREFS